LFWNLISPFPHQWMPGLWTLVFLPAHLNKFYTLRVF
jgi:hypothetical protein